MTELVTAAGAAAPPDGMRLRPDPDAVEFAASVRGMLAQHADREALGAAWDSDGGRIPGLWRRFAEAGATGLVVPEDDGGAGLDLSGALPLLIEAGRAAVPEPLVATTVAAALLAAAGGDAAREWLPRIADGSAAVGIGLGDGDVVLGGQWADALLLREPDGSGVHLVATADIRLTPIAAADRGTRLATARWTPSPTTLVAGLAADAALDTAAVAVAAELLGVAGTLLDTSVDYAKTREQFGRPIGAFQAVKHHLADVYVRLAFARPVVARAFDTALRRPTGGAVPERSRDASHALAAAGAAARLAARTALQVHAGIGYTYEHDLHMWLKRTWTLTSVLGDPAWHRERVARIVLDGAGDPGTAG